MSESLAFTGERFVPECVREIWYEHWHRYVLAQSLVNGRRVLDVACGEGYGSDLLAREAAWVWGVDRSHETCRHASRRYRARGNLGFIAADCAALPLSDNSVDCAVSFETLEHIEAQQAMLAELRRVVVDDGCIVLSSPDKRVYSDATGHVNEFHVRELYRDELIDMVRAQFPALRLLGQKLLFQSAIWCLDTVADRCHVTVADGDDVQRHGIPPYEPMYYVVCAAADEAHLPALPGGLWLFGDSDESVYAHYNAEVRKNIEAGHLLASYEQQIKDYEEALAERDRMLAEAERRATDSAPLADQRPSADNGTTAHNRPSGWREKARRWLGL